MSIEGSERPRANVISETIESEKPEETDLESLTYEGISKALTTLRERFENNTENPENNLEYHVSRHSRNIIRRTALILSALHGAEPERYSKRNILLGEFAAAFHDTVQNYRVEKGKRVRETIQNEEESIEEALEEMRALNQKYKQEIFTEEDMQTVRGAIIVTIPEFDPTLKTVIQPRLIDSENTENSVALGVALADLGTAGMDGPEDFIREGNELFREENLDIKEALANPDSISDEQKESFRSRMLAWTKTQGDFAKGRKARLGQELSGLSEVAATAVKNLFTKFDATIEAAEAKAVAREKMSFEELVQDMGYLLNKNEKTA